MRADVVVCGLGPSGRALAHRFARRDVDVVVVDPAPRRAWLPTYAAWSDELPDWLPASVVAARVEQPHAFGARPHRIDREYVVFDNARLRAALELGETRVVTGKVGEIYRGAARLTDGTTIRADRIIDAMGIGVGVGRPEQTAYGLVLPQHVWGEQPLFMDWRREAGSVSIYQLHEPASFLYAVPLNAESMLVEETCLVGNPGLGFDELRARLLRRLGARGILPTGAERIERVRFPVHGARAGSDRFGAAGGFTHPATGYSVAAALSAADDVAAGASAAPGAVRVTGHLRAAGLRALLSLPPVDIPVFFDTFFDLPSAKQRAYLSARADPAATAGAMRTLFAELPPALRRRVAAATLGLANRSRPTTGSSMMEK